MNSEIARIHREGVILELEQIGKELGSKYSQEWFEEVWEQKSYVGKFYIVNGKTTGFQINYEGELMVYVHSDYRRERIGSFLIRDNVKGEIWVLNGNKIAENFYTKNGFHKTGRSRNNVMFGHEVTENLWDNETN